jgi:hypothetical protein
MAKGTTTVDATRKSTPISRSPQVDVPFLELRRGCWNFMVFLGGDILGTLNQD